MMIERDQAMDIDTKRILDTLISHPLLTSLLVASVALLTLMHSLPWLFSLLLVSVVIAVALYFGQKLQLFNKY